MTFKCHTALTYHSTSTEELQYIKLVFYLHYRYNTTNGSKWYRNYV